jgi:hypothetical protein
VIGLKQPTSWEDTKTTSTKQTLLDGSCSASQSAKKRSAHVTEISPDRHKAVAVAFPHRCRTADHRGPRRVVRGRPSAKPGDHAHPARPRVDSLRSRTSGGTGLGLAHRTKRRPVARRKGWKYRAGPDRERQLLSRCRRRRHFGDQDYKNVISASCWCLFLKTRLIALVL